MSEQAKRTHRGQKFGIVISTRIGNIAVAFTDDRTLFLHQVDKAGRQGVHFTYDGKEYVVSAVLQQMNGLWVTWRTESGNEAKHGLDVHEYAHNYTPAPKRIKDAVREAILDSVNRYFESRPELIAEARATEQNNAIVRAQDALDRARAAAAKCEAELASALAAEGK